MPKQTHRNSASRRLAKRADQDEIRRSELLAMILEESSSVSLNDGFNESSPRQVLEDHFKLLDLINELKELELTLNVKLPCRTEKNWEKFFNWIDSELGGTDATNKLSQRIDATNKSSDYNGYEEYALVSKIKLNKNDNIFSIPRRIMISTETASQDPELDGFIRKDSIASAMQNVVLVLHLLNEYSKGNRSYWYPYLSILPNQVLPIMTMNKEQLKNLLASSHIFEVLKMIRAIARQYSYFYKRLESTNLPLKKHFTLQYYIWGVSVVCSRQNEIPSQDGESTLSHVVHALIPILDMCNHDHSSNQAIFESNQSHLMAFKDFDIGDEITINYGSRSSGEFYIHNGFVPRQVPFDVIPLIISLNKQDRLFDAKLKLLKTLNMPTFGKFRLTRNDYENRHKRDPHLTMFLIVYSLNEEELNFINNSLNPVGIADEIYEYIHYYSNQSALNTASEDKTGPISSSGIISMKERLNKSVKEYLSRRASIGIALIERTLKDDNLMDYNTSLLLKHEHSIFESYSIKYNTI